jgi:hypothetical protein
VARGLALHGRWQDRVRRFNQAVEELAHEPATTRIIHDSLRRVCSRLGDRLGRDFREVTIMMTDRLDSGDLPLDRVGDPHFWAEFYVAYLGSPAGEATKKEVFRPLTDRLSEELDDRVKQICVDFGIPDQVLETTDLLPDAVDSVKFIPKVVPKVIPQGDPALLEALAWFRRFSFADRRRRALFRAAARLGGNTGVDEVLGRIGRLIRFDPDGEERLRAATAEQIKSTLGGRAAIIQALLAGSPKTLPFPGATES